MTDHCLRSRDYVNVIVAGKQPAPQWLDMDAAVKHCTAGIGIWEWASNDQGASPTSSWPAPATCPRSRRWPRSSSCASTFPELKIRVVNVVDLMKLQPPSEHPHGLTDREFDGLFTDRQADHLRLPRLPVADPPPDLPPHQPREPPRPRLQGGGDDDDALRHGRAQRPRPLPSRPGRDRPRARPGCALAYVRQRMAEKLVEHAEYIRRHGDDMPEVKDWRWALA